uniref:hypothetical protein n=1 Tax=Saccharothrix espanaensis TaxID=103731 RepID=UPI003F493EC6
MRVRIVPRVQNVSRQRAQGLDFTYAEFEDFLLTAEKIGLPDRTPVLCTCSALHGQGHIFIITTQWRPHLAEDTTEDDTATPVTRSAPRTPRPGSRWRRAAPATW